MQFVCGKRDLIAALRIGMRAVANKATMPILECLLIEADENGIRITSNDAEFGISTMVKESTVRESGRIAVDAKLFNDIIGKAQVGDISVVSDDANNSIMIKSGKSKFNVPYKNADDFIKLPETETGTVVKLDQSEFCNVVSRTLFCVSTDNKNRMMTGECFEIRDNEFSITALDGHRVAIRTMQLNESYPRVRVTVPSKILSEIIKIMDGTEVEMNVSRNHVVFTFGNTKAVTRVIEGDYFDIDKLTSDNANIVVSAYTNQLSAAVARAKILVREGDKKPLIADITNDNMHLSVTTNLGSTSEDVGIEKMGDDLRIGLNPQFILDAINNIEDDEVEMRFINAKSPVFFKKTGGTYNYIVLPVNI